MALCCLLLRHFLHVLVLVVLFFFSRLDENEEKCSRNISLFSVRLFDAGLFEQMWHRGVLLNLHAVSVVAV